ncbi:hypothetical protein F2P79_025248 [Pimephales promelas]|nr:hypothetical protein F2P79_025248 [Pimephales promelas]
MAQCYPATAQDRRTHVCLSGGERLMMLNAVIKGFETFVVEQDLQGKMMDLKCLQTGVSTEDEELRAESWKWCHG